MILYNTSAIGNFNHRFDSAISQHCKIFDIVLTRQQTFRSLVFVALGIATLGTGIYSCTNDEKEISEKGNYQPKQRKIEKENFSYKLIYENRELLDNPKTW
ncbi:hypothetical protein AB4865_02295 [Capnocytophaga sp. ARDL2]|uniref:hypothetical protein n=1 Tax=Capnocytophaga sp. ARDL2 TaxID=3238809 RepID=UPI0035588F9C